MKTVGIFRNQLFKGSEIFISQQAEALRNFGKCYIGRKIMGTEPPSATVWVLNKDNTIREKYNEILNALSLSAAPYQHILHSQPLDLIHAHFAIDGVYALSLAKKKDIPLITTLHGFDVTVSKKELLNSRSPAWINYFLHQNKLKKNGEKFICVSQFIAEQAVRNGFPEGKIIQHYIGIDVDKYLQSEPLDDSGIILHVARLVEKKGTAILVTALKHIQKRYPEVKLVIVGDGPLLPQLRAQISSLGLDNNVIFTGALAHVEVMELMRKAHMLILPSITAKTGDAEGLGMVLLEAAVTGVPVIGTNHGGIPEAIIDGETGFLVDENNDRQLAERILFLMDNRTTRLSMGKKAREFVAQKFNLTRQTKKLEEIYKDVIHGQ